MKKYFLCFILISISMDKLFSQSFFNSVDDTVNTFNYSYKLKKKALSPKTQLIAYYDKAIQFGLLKVSAQGNIPAAYNVSKKVSTITFDSAAVKNSITFDIYKIIIDAGFKSNSLVSTGIQSFDVPFYKHPYTLYITSVNKNEILMMGVIFAKGSISKEKDKLIREGILYVKKKMEVPA